MFPTVLAVGTAEGGAGAASSSRRRDRTSNGEVGAEVLDMFVDQKSQICAGFLCSRCKQRIWIT
jgi:hypothetical protein